jgi:hypothetical protein
MKHNPNKIVLAFTRTILFGAGTGTLTLDLILGKDAL